jgi:hypothetical protein
LKRKTLVKVIVVTSLCILLTSILYALAATFYFQGNSPKYKWNPDQAFGQVEISIDDNGTMTPWTAQDMTTEKNYTTVMWARWTSTAVGHAGNVTVAWQLQSSTDGLTNWTPIPNQYDINVTLSGSAGQIVNASSLAVWHNFVPAGGFAVNLYYQIVVTIS